MTGSAEGNGDGQTHMQREQREDREPRLGRGANVLLMRRTWIFYTCRCGASEATDPDFATAHTASCVVVQRVEEDDKGPNVAFLKI